MTKGQEPGNVPDLPRKGGDVLPQLGALENQRKYMQHTPCLLLMSVVVWLGGERFIKEERGLGKNHHIS